MFAKARPSYLKNEPSYGHSKLGKQNPQKFKKMLRLTKIWITQPISKISSKKFASEAIKRCGSN